MIAIDINKARSVGRYDEYKARAVRESPSHLFLSAADYRRIKRQLDGSPDGASAKTPARPKTPRDIALAESRAAVCEPCEYNQGLKRTSPKGWPIYTVRCKGCGCGALPLTNPDAQCKRGKWEASNPVKPLPPVKITKPLGPPVQFKQASGSTAMMQGLYQGRSAFLICGGPSLNSLDLDKLRQPGILTMGINNSPKVFRPNLWTAGDSPSNFIRSIWLDPAITKFVPKGHRKGKVFDSDAWTDTGLTASDCPNVWFFERTTDYQPDKFLTTDKIDWGREQKAGGGRCSMQQALRLLYELGVRRVFLLGVDFNMEAGKEYAFKQHKRPGQIKTNNGRFGNMAKRYAELRPILDAAGFHVYNCNPASKLTAFDHVPFDEAVKAAVAEFGNINVVKERTAGLYEKGEKEKPHRTYLAVGPSETRLMKACKSAGLNRVVPEVIKKAKQFQSFVRSGLKPDLIVMWGFVSFRDEVRRWAADHAVPIAWGEVGWFPHYATFAADPQGFCWESSICAARFVDDGRSYPQAEALRAAHQVADRPLPDGVQEPFALWATQLIGDRVNTFGVNADDWAPYVRHFRSLLPADVQLVIKTHPRAAKRPANDQPVARLRELARQLPNTVFLDGGDLGAMLGRARAVAAMNSTVLYEARLLHDTPAYAYAPSWYTGHPTLIAPLRLDTAELPAIDVASPAACRYRDWFIQQLLDRQIPIKTAKKKQDKLWAWLTQWAAVPKARNSEKLRVLVGNHHLKHLGGTETWTRSMAQELARRGHEVSVLGEKVGPFAKTIGLPVLTAKQLRPGMFDAALVNQANIAAAVSRAQTSLIVIQTLHGQRGHQEHPDANVDRHVTITEELRGRWEQQGIPSVVIRNGIDLNIYKPTSVVSPGLRRVGLFCKSTRPVAIVRAACEMLGVEMITIGAGKLTPTPWEPINTCDLVVAVGRAAMEAMACGRPVVIYDDRDYQPNVTDGYFQAGTEAAVRIMSHNYTGRAFKIPASAATLAAALRRYDPNDGNKNRKWIQEHHSVAGAADAYLSLITAVRATKTGATATV